MGRDAYVWEPTAEALEHAHATAFMREHGISGWRELIERSQDDIEWFWDAAVRFLGIEFFQPYERVLDTSARHGLGDLVHRRHGEPHPQLRRPPPCRPSCRHLGERGRVGRASDVRRARRRDEPPRQCAPRAWGGARRCGRALPADVDPGRRGLLRRMQDRRDRGADLLGVRRAGRRGPPRRRRCGGAPHRRRGAAARAARVDEGDRRRRRGRRADRAPRRRVGPARDRPADGGRPRPPLGRDRRPPEPRAGGARRSTPRRR